MPDYGMSGPTIDLHLYFAGLMVFNDGNNGVEALVVDARSPGRVAGTEGAEPHQAIVQFAWDQAVGDTTPFDSFEDSEKQKKGYWLLDRDIVEVVPSAEVLQGALGRSYAALQGETPSAVDVSSLEWTAPLRGAGEAAQLKAAGTLHSSGGPLVASVKLERGTLSPAGFAAETTKFVISQFPNNKTQSMASVLELQETVAGTSVCLAARKFNGDPGETLELVPSPGSNRIEVWVLNREWPAIVDQRPARAVELGQPNPEYLFFHDLLVNPPVDLPRATNRAVGNGVRPAFRPCLDRGMRKLYFAEGGGETSLHAPCSPAFAKTG